MSSILDRPEIRKAVLPITVEQYHRLGQTGIILERTELLRGVIVEKMIKSPLHSWFVHLLAEWLRASVGTDFHVRQEQPLTLADSEPEPDIALVRGAAEDYRQSHPSAADLVIEVAIATEGLDREKAALYAAAAVPEYWLVLPNAKAVEVFSQPSASGYTVCRRYSAEETVSAGSFPELSLDLSRLFA